MKPIQQKHPRLYFNILNKNGDDYEFEYYDNKYSSEGNYKISSTLMKSKIFLDYNSEKEKLYSLNKIEFQLLNALIKKQEKVIKVYLKNNKKDQYEIVNSSLQFLFGYKNRFLEWFANNKIL